MKVVKKHLAFVLILTFIMSLVGIGAYAQETEEKVTVEKNINLALHRSVVSSAGNTNAALLTDGRYNTEAVSGTASEGETFTVDLERLARITDIKLLPIQNSGSIAGSKMSDVALEVSIDGDSWNTVATQGTVSSSITKDDAFTAELDGEDYYRFVRIRKTVAGAYEYGELEVFADVVAVEVSRNKKVTATSESSAAPTAYTLESVVDGVTTAFGWLVEADLYGEKCISIDLGEETPIDWIEMYTRRGIVAGAAYHRNWIAYGLDDGQENNILTPDGVGTKLFESMATSASEANFPVNVEENDPNNHLYETLDGKTAYRHLSFRKTSLYLGIAEIGAFAIMPEAASAEISGSVLTVSFTEKMNTNTFDDIVVKIDGQEIVATVDAVDDYTAQVEFDNIHYGSKVDVVVPETVESARGFNVHPSVKTCYFPQAVEASELVFLNGTDDDSTEITSLSGNESVGVKMSFKNNQPEKTENVIMIATLYDRNHTVIRMKTQKITLEPLSDEKTLIAGFDLPEDTEGCVLSVFVWKDYRFMSPWFMHESIS